MLSGDTDEQHFAAEWARPDGSSAGALIRLPSGIRAGTDYFVQPSADGGAIIARGLWDDTHTGVGVIRLDARGRVSSFSLLPEPSTRQDARFSTVRWHAGRILLAQDRPDGYAISSYKVVGR